MKISPDGKTITMRMPDNWHAHFRDGPLMRFLVGIFIAYGWLRRIIAMPNLHPPVLTGEHAIRYCESIKSVARGIPCGEKLEPVPVIQITESTTPQMVSDAYAAGVQVCKVYPRNVTTNSEYGVVDYTKIYPALQVAEERGMIVQFHAEHPSYEVQGRFKEEAFIEILEAIRRECPLLCIAVEHVSSEKMVEWVKRQPAWVGASITIQHLMLTADDLAGYSKRSKGLICVHDGAFKPGAKDVSDRDAIRKAAFSGNKKFWYGGDDAAHLKSKKECAHPSCGAWNTMAALSMLISLFKEHGVLDKLEPFLSEFGAEFFGYRLNEGVITFIRKDWNVARECAVPELNDSIVPFFEGEPMEWELVVPVAA